GTRMYDWSFPELVGGVKIAQLAVRAVCLDGVSSSDYSLVDHHALIEFVDRVISRDSIVLKSSVGKEGKEGKEDKETKEIDEFDKSSSFREDTQPATKKAFNDIRSVYAVCGCALAVQCEELGQVNLTYRLSVSDCDPSVLEHLCHFSKAIKANMGGIGFRLFLQKVHGVFGEEVCGKLFDALRKDGSEVSAALKVQFLKPRESIGFGVPPAQLRRPQQMQQMQMPMQQQMQMPMQIQVQRRAFPTPQRYSNRNLANNSLDMLALPSQMPAFDDFLQ
ncbi:hypothetical protein ADUPG1_010227, partial [Aduncisulcus paluster]